MSKKERKDPAYLREQGTRTARGPKQRLITFSLAKHLSNQGQTINEWEQSGLLSLLFTRLKFIGQYTVAQALNNKYIKCYTKVDFPPDSEFKQPPQFINITWAVMHITDKSKEVVVGFIEEEVFQIIFLDKDHKFWPSNYANN